MPPAYPSRRSMGRFLDEEVDISVGGDVIEPCPWIDVHGHHNTISWRDREEFDIAGCLAVVMAGGLAYETPYRPIAASDVQRGWDDTIRKCHTLSRSHLFEAYASVAVHTSLGPVEDLDVLFDRLPEYAALDEVVSISETGISMVQEHATVPLSDQRDVVREHLHIARETGLPVVLHTPTTIKGTDEFAALSIEAHDIGDRVLEPESAKLDATKIMVDLADEVGLPQDRLVFTHAHRSMAPWVLDNTDCHLSFTVGNAERDIHPHDIADAVSAYGPERIMMDSDSAYISKVEPFAIKRAMIELYRRGIAPPDVRTIAYENARDLLALDALPA